MWCRPAAREGAPVARVRVRAAIVVSGLLLAACKDPHARAPAASPEPAPAPAAPAAPARPALPADAAARPALPTDAAGSAAPTPLTVDQAAAQLPKLDGDAMLPLKTTGDGMQAHATWCLAGTGADAVAESLAKTMSGAGYTNITTRGDAQKAGVTGEHDAWRLSYVVSASSAANCRAPGHYFASATLFRAR